MLKTPFPFKVQPTVNLVEIKTSGSLGSGIIEIESKRYFTIEEKAMIESAKIPDMQKDIAQLAKKLTDLLNKSPHKPKDSKRVGLLAVYDAITRRLNGDFRREDQDLALIGEFLEELNAIQKRGTEVSDQRIESYALVICKSRLGIDPAATAKDLEETIGERLMTELGLFAIFEELGREYKSEVKEEPENKEAEAEEVTEEALLE